MADIIARRGTGREAAQIGADVEREKIPFLKQKTEAELGEIEARTGMYGRSGKVDYSDPRVQAAMFDNNIKSLATSGRHWDHTTGKPSEEMADPKEVAAAQALLNVGQQGDLGAMMLRVLPTMLASNDTEQNELGKQMWKDLTGYWYDDTGPKLFGLERGVVRPGELGGKAQAENVESVKARIEFMEDLMLTMGIDDPETRAEINRMKESIGMPTEEPVRTRGPMDYK